jgi:tetratricopeptide (TPR) repeat protein
MKLLLIILFYVSILGWAWGDSLASKNRDANKLYKEGRIDEALSRWREAQIENPDNDKLHYNIGNGLHDKKDYEGAFKEYEKSLGSKNSELRSKAYYNIGNTRYRMGKLPEAIDDYKKCLEINPEDEDAKYNIEFIEKKLKEQPKKEEQQEKESQQKEGQKEQREQRESGKAEEEKGSEEKEQQIAKEEKKDEMSKEDAVRLLDALKDDEKDVQKELRNQSMEGRYKVDKDW